MKKKARHHRPAVLKRDSSPIKPSANRETLTYAQAQRMVELEVDGRVHRLSILDKMDVIGEDDPTAQEILECNSNKENNDKPQQVLVRSVRLKNSQQKKNAALTTATTTTTTHAGGTVATQGSSAIATHHGNASGLLEAKVRTVEYNLPVVPRRHTAYYKYTERTEEELDEEVEYDMDEEDYAWLELINEKRKSEGCSQVSHNLFEFLMDRFEKESFAATQGQTGQQSLVDEDAVCCVCMDGDGADSNVILFCDSCNIAVHQECYGVPYVPEGQWLCRHCLQCSSRPAECVFCPNKGGALKKTDDDRWGHVACALWVPEVGFSDTVFIEPIDGVRNIPPARWKLTCYLCKEKGAGACIQCDKINCYAAFHVSCAQQAGLYMRMEPVKEVTTSGAATFSVKKTAYCCSHTPEGCDRRPLNVYQEAPHHNNHNHHPKNGALHSKRGEHKRGKARAKTWCRKKSKRVAETEPEKETQSNAGPSITASSLDTILNQVAVQRKRPFVAHVLSYWVQKRQSRNNVPLIRRLQANPQPPKAPAKPMDRAETNAALKEQLKEWHRLRHDLERARLLLELIRKREKLKREEMKQQQAALEVQLTPFNILLRAVLSQLQEKDQYNIYAQPVSVKEVPDYLDVIKNPMDFSTMRKRIDAHEYRSLEDFESDFDLVISNCLKYNSKDNFFYKAGQRMQDHGGVILRRARREAERIGFDFPSGLHLPQAPKLEPPPPFSWEDVDRVLSPSYRRSTPPERYLGDLLERLDQSTAMKHSPSRSRRLKALKRHIAEVRTEISLKKNALPLTTATQQPVATETSPSPIHTHTQPTPPSEPEMTPLPETKAAVVAKETPLPTLELLTTLSHLHTSPSNPDLEHTPMELDTHTHADTHADTHTDTHIDTEKHTDTKTDTHTEKHTNTHTDAHTNTHTETHAETHAHTDTHTSTSVPAVPPNGLLKDPPLRINGNLHTHTSIASGNNNRRTNGQFRKSKSASPQKPAKTREGKAGTTPLPPSPSLGNKTFLSVVIPRLETLLRPKKRTRSSSAEKEEEESPIKRLGTGLVNGFVVEEDLCSSPRLEPRRRCASESSISSSGSLLCSSVTVSKAKGRPPPSRRSTVDDRSSLKTCEENGEPNSTALSPDRVSPVTEEGVTSPLRGGASRPARRAESVQVRRETLPRPLLRQQAQLAMAS